MSIKDRLSDPTLLVERASVAGAWIGAATGGTIPVVNPATGEAIATVPDLGAGETRDAIAAAERAWPAWRARPAAERSALLERWHDLMLENLEDLAVIMTAEQGKPLAEARGEVRYGASFVKWFAEEARARLRRGHPRAHGRPPHRGPEGARRRVGGDHALELPERDDHAQGGPGPRRGLPDGRETVRVHAALRPRPGGAGGARRDPAGRAQRRDRHVGRDRRRDDRQYKRAQALLHRIDAGRPYPDGAVRRRP